VEARSLDFRFARTGGALGGPPFGIATSLSLAEVESAVEGGVWSLVFHFRCDADRPPAPGSAIAEARFFQIEHLPPTAHGAWERDVIYRVMTGAG